MGEGVAILSFSILFRVLLKWDKVKADRISEGSIGKLGKLDRDDNFFVHFI